MGRNMTGKFAKANRSRPYSEAPVMKITNVDVLTLSGTGRQGQYGLPTGTLVRIGTDAGITGWGETRPQADQRGNGLAGRYRH